MVEDKNQIRKKCLSNRLKYDNLFVSNNVIKEIINKGIIDKYNHIGIYYPIGKEINIMPLLEKYPNKSFYLPITRDEISFIKYNLNDKLIDGSFHTKEPIGDITNRDLIECFLIPCVGISKDLKRIGYGKGYYDRYLNGYNGYKVGICYKADTNLDIELCDYDLKLDCVITGDNID